MIGIDNFSLAAGIVLLVAGVALLIASMFVWFLVIYAVILLVFGAVILITLREQEYVEPIKGEKNKRRRRQ